MGGGRLILVVSFIYFPKFEGGKIDKLVLKHTHTKKGGNCPPLPFTPSAPDQLVTKPSVQDYK